MICLGTLARAIFLEMAHVSGIAFASWPKIVEVGYLGIVGATLMSGEPRNYCGGSTITTMSRFLGEVFLFSSRQMLGL